MSQIECTLKFEYFCTIFKSKNLFSDKKVMLCGNLPNLLISERLIATVKPQAGW